LHKNFAKFHGCEKETHEDFSQFLLAIHILIPDLYYKASNTFKHESLKETSTNDHSTFSKTLRYTWLKTLERCSGAPVDVLHQPHLSNASTNIQALARRWLTWHL